MNSTTQSKDVISFIQGHRSIRKFTTQRIPAEQMKQIIASAQMASTSSHMQAYSIIGVTEQDKKSKLADLAGNQSYVENCSHFLVFCADLYRLEQVSNAQGTDIRAALESTEMFMVATIDAALAAQNAALAAEALGLGVVYIGGIRNNPEAVSDLLGLPHKVYPVFGMCVGYPDQDPQVKPRLPLETVYFENTYPQIEQVQNQLEQFDQTMSEYYKARTAGKRTDSWSELISRGLQTPKRIHMKDFLAKRGFPLK